MTTADNTYDFIVTGAGSAGCAVAGRLSESGRWRVLLLEAGGRDSNPWIHIPLGYTKTFTNPRVNWMFESEPEKELNNRTLYQPRGKVLGGTSSINGMVYMRGTSADYDNWRQRGCEGWDWDSVLPFFKKAEDQERGADDFHAVGGVYGSPQLLQLSGLGPADLLSEFGIPVVRDMSGVGKNLHDHFNTYLVFRCPQKVTVNDMAMSPALKLKAAVQYAVSRSGHLSNAGIYAGALVRTDPRLVQPDLQINMSGWSAIERLLTGIKPQPFSAFTLSPVHLRPEGRGWVRIKSPDPLAPPAIQFNFLASDYDFQALIYGSRLARKIAAQPALQPFIVEEVLPGPACQSDDQFVEEI